MKYLIILLFICLFFITCRKVDDVVLFNSGSMKFGKVSAKLNNKDWTASANAVNEKDGKFISIIASTYFDGKMDYRTEHFSLYLAKKIGKKKEFLLSPNERKGEEILALYNVLEDDVPRIGFDLDISKNSNFVEIVSIDSTHVTGKFDLTFKSSNKVNGKNLIYRFKEGQFDARIVK